MPIKSPVAGLLISIVSFLILGAFLSPPDPLSQLLIALPLYILYELSIIVSYFFRVKL